MPNIDEQNIDYDSFIESIKQDKALRFYLNPVVSSALPIFKAILASFVLNQWPNFWGSVLGRYVFLGFIIDAFLAILIGASWNIFKFPVTQRSLKGLVGIYFSTALSFASIYFMLIACFPLSEAFCGIKKLPNGLMPIGAYSQELFLIFVDCFHYSVVTITTLGFGDITPKAWYTKLITDLEVLLGVAIVSVAIGRYFYLLSCDTKRNKTR